MIWVYIWLGVVVASLILEFVTMELVSIWISVGSFVGMILAFCGVGYEIQLVVAIAISIICILALRKVTLKFLNRNQDKTNLDVAIGEKIKLLDDVSFDKMGSVKYNGVLWSVKAENKDEKIKKGRLVEIVKFEGNKIIVRPIDDINENSLETNKSKEAVNLKSKKDK